MGSIVIPYEDYSSRYSGTGHIVCLYELRPNGVKDVSHILFANIAGENLVLSSNKVYLVGISTTDLGHSSEEGALRSAVNHVYKGLWSQEDMVSGSRTYSQYISEVVMGRSVTINRWRKDASSRNKNGFSFKVETMSDLAYLGTCCVFSLVHPPEMSYEDLDSYLEAYGGVSGIDVREILFRGHKENMTEVGRHVVSCRTFILPTPVVTPSNGLQAMLFTAKILCKSSKEALRSGSLREFCYALKRGDSPVVQHVALCVYKYVTHLWRDVCAYFLDIERVLYEISSASRGIFSSDSGVRDLLLAKMQAGYQSNPSVGKIKEYKLSRIMPDLYPEFQVAELDYLIKETSDYVRSSDCAHSKALLDSAVSTASRVSSVLSSVTYFSKDMCSLAQLQLDKVPRWKGSRKEREAKFAANLFTLKCIFKTPAMVGDMLRLAFPFYSIRNDLIDLGRVLHGLTQTDNSLRITEQEWLLCKQVDMEGTNESKAHRSRLSAYLDYRTVSSYCTLVHYLVKQLEISVNSPRVENSLESGIQVCPTGSLFSTDYLPIMGGWFGSSSSTPTIPGLATSQSLLEDISIILDSKPKDLDPSVLKSWVESVILSIQRILEVASSCVLKSEDYWFVTVHARPYLVQSFWESKL